MLEKLFAPSSVAVVGASRTPGKVGHDILANLVAGGFSGEIIPVNPAGGTMFERKVVAKLADHRGAIDQVIIVVPSQQVLEVAREAVARKAGAIIVISAGFRHEPAPPDRKRKQIGFLEPTSGA